jgi:hypothetical protein
MENLLNLDWVSLQLDVFKAFNELDRAIIFKQVFEQIPQALAYVQYKNGQAAALHAQWLHIAKLNWSPPR